jgi:hypothetical protein
MEMAFLAKLDRAEFGFQCQATTLKQSRSLQHGLQV